MSDFSNRKEFLRWLEAMIQDDAHHFEFTVSFNSGKNTMPAAVPGAAREHGLLITEVRREPITMDGSFARYSIEGKL